MAPVRLIRFSGATAELKDSVANVLARCGDYYEAVHGRPANAEDVEGVFHAEVPGIPPEDIRSYGIYAGDELVGLGSIILGWKRPGQSMIGFLAVADQYRGKGYARAAAEALEAVARASAHGTSMRIGIIETNAPAFGFWRHLGFVETGERKTLEEFKGDVILLEKALDG
jgi:ribosomal protein S18 acetylase RimI-like enzyme